MARRKIGLGKGLSALIPDGSDEAMGPPAGVYEISLAAISPNPHQPRSALREEDLAELAASIEEHGIIQPLVVTEVADGYQLIAGERRWRAARVAGLSTVPVLIKYVAPSRVLEVGAQVADYCRSQGVDIADLAMQFVYQHDYVATTLVGMSKVRNVDRNVKSVGVAPDPETLAEVLAMIKPVADVVWKEGRPENYDPGSVEKQS